ncbi:RNA polymerase sigma-70 factor [Fodinibius salsisoli]|uniref:RNA polymerase sigma-70 factor n=1 Tax=Fodinibius salsisoli TaxID=2820877 RepID=A0ABT3PLE0_9BACT|nr:RNA polymerase sigma-70 factor [Fodinibius salsisoli]MCW9706573.1 RNA polymerase sigma-70 factor [Fodinibius salsisoli]
MKSSVDKDRIKRETRWVKEIQKGKRDSFKALYQFYYPRLSQFVFRYVKSKAIAEDLVHNVFHNIWKNRNNLKANGKLRAYLYTAVRNQSFKFLNRRKGQLQTTFDDLSFLESREANPEEQINGKEFEEAIQSAIRELPKRRRAVFLMSREDDLTYREIAEVLEISVKTVETQMSRSLKHLRHRLAHFISSENVST